MQLDLGSRVRTSDGHNAGKIKRIIFDTEKMTVREFVIREGTLFRSDRIVDLNLIEAVDDEHVVTLKVAAADIDDLPVYIRELHTPVFTGDMHHARQIGDLVQLGSVPKDAVVLSHGSQVYDLNGEHIGHLDEIVYGVDGAASAFIVDSGFLFDREVTVPVSVIDSITHGRIELKIRVEELEQAPVA
jgi:uncharacterized protein YrrD